MNLLLKLTLVALVSNQVFTLPSLNAKDTRSAQEEDEELSWWEALLSYVWDWVTGVVSDVVWGILGDFGESVQAYFDQIFAVEDEDLAHEAEDVLVDGDLASKDGDQLIADGQVLLDLAEEIRNTDINDVDQAEVDAVIAAIEAAGNAIINAGTVVIAEADFLTETLAAATDGDLDETVVAESEARVTEAVNDAQVLLADAQTALNDLLAKSADLNAAIPAGGDDSLLEGVLADLTDTVNQFTSLVNDIWTLANSIWDEGLSFFGISDE